MTPGGDLTLLEELLLLALKGDEGTVHSGADYHHALAGALVAELLLRGRITMDRAKQGLVRVVDASPTGDPLLDEAIERMASAKRRGSVQTWVSRLAGIKQLKHRVAAQLVDGGVLRSREARVLLLFTRRVHPERDPTVEGAIVERLGQVIFGEAAHADARTIVLLALAYPCGLLQAHFDRKRLEAREKHLEAIVAGNVVGQATKQVMDAVRAAVIAASVAATAATTGR